MLLAIGANAPVRADSQDLLVINLTPYHAKVEITYNSMFCRVDRFTMGPKDEWKMHARGCDVWKFTTTLTDENGTQHTCPLTQKEFSKRTNFRIVKMQN